MIAALAMLAEELKEAFLLPHLRHCRTKLMVALVTVMVVFLFALMALLCLFMLVFIGLSPKYGPEQTAFGLFCFSLLICFGAIGMHWVGRRYEETVHERRLAELKGSIPGAASLKEMAFNGPVRDYFADNKVSALMFMAALGLIFGARPKAAPRKPEERTAPRRRRR
jgi:uncharacterized membrane protein YqjE